MRSSALSVDLTHHGDADLVPGLTELLAAAQPLWAVSAPALAACVATASPAALAEAGQRTATAGGIRVVPHPAASFVLIDTPVSDMRSRLLGRGLAVRRGETFPGLGPTWIRVAVRDAPTADKFAAALTASLADG